MSEEQQAIKEKIMSIHKDKMKNEPMYRAIVKENELLTVPEMLEKYKLILF